MMKHLSKKQKQQTAPAPEAEQDTSTTTAQACSTAQQAEVDPNRRDYCYAFCS